MQVQLSSRGGNARLGAADDKARIARLERMLVEKEEECLRLRRVVRELGDQMARGQGGDGVDPTCSATVEGKLLVQLSQENAALKTQLRQQGGAPPPSAAAVACPPSRTEFSAAAPPVTQPSYVAVKKHSHRRQPEEVRVHVTALDDDGAGPPGGQSQMGQSPPAAGHLHKVPSAMGRYDELALLDIYLREGDIDAYVNAPQPGQAAYGAVPAPAASPAPVWDAPAAAAASPRIFCPPPAPTQTPPAIPTGFGCHGML
eukprot:TRINITY_DN28943_c0_g1_i1.p2 TRINITY_DN28943_c0_g1~~TRINITY_DN28943_c0_g1_i1.p2  ORF type:complete len:258 (+),score=55.45 TRINITY_DN28943_c0_g1_i1:97-870(+)